MPSLARLARHFKGAEAARFALIAVNEDRGGPDRALPFLKRIGLPDLPVYFDGTGEAQRLIGAGSLPTTVVIDGRGRERGRLVGPADWSSPEAVALIRHFISAER
jgi:thiol-disulfide isomerase/thioredoxin